MLGRPSSTLVVAFVCKVTPNLHRSHQIRVGKQRPHKSKPHCSAHKEKKRIQHGLQLGDVDTNQQQAYLKGKGRGFRETDTTVTTPADTLDTFTLRPLYPFIAMKACFMPPCLDRLYLHGSFNAAPLLTVEALDLVVAPHPVPRCFLPSSCHLQCPIY